MLLLLVLLSLGCALGPVGQAPQASATLGANQAKKDTPQRKPTLPFTRTPRPSLTVTLPPTDTPLPTETPLPTQTPTSLPTRTALPLPDIPETLLYAAGGGGVAPCEELANPHEATGLLASLWKDELAPSPRLVNVCIWGLPLGETVRLRATSPDGEQQYSVLLRTVLDKYGVYKVEWDGTMNWVNGSGYLGTNRIPYIETTLWLPGDVPPGEWKMEAVTLSRRADGKLTVPPASGEWLSLKMEGDALQPAKWCHVLPPGQAALPLEVLGGGFKPGQPVPLILFGLSENLQGQILQRGQVVWALADDRGQIKLTLDQLPTSPPGEYRLWAFTTTTKPFFKEKDLYGLKHQGDCFLIQVPDDAGG
jgi:hypothetical protein